MSDIIKITTVTRTDGAGLAVCFGLDRTRIVQLANEGVLIRDGNSKYLVAENIRRYLAYKSGGQDGQVSLDDEKTLHEKAKRQLTELELAKKLGTLHEARDIEIMVGGMITVFKRRILSIPHKMALVLANQAKSPDEINEILTNEVHRALTELSNFDVSKIPEIVNQADFDDSESEC